MKNCFLLFLLASASLFAQDRKLLNGKVISDFDSTAGIYVINKATEATVLTNADGYFAINTCAGDTLVFSAVQFNEKRVTVLDEDINNGFLFVGLKPYKHQLDELVIVDYSHINSYSLGLVEKGKTPPTPAERKLNTASAFKNNPMGLDPILNLISGRTANLKRALATEKKEQLMAKIDYLYTSDDIRDEFKIPEKYVRGFVYYIVENKFFVNAMKAKNEKMAKFLMHGLAVKYLELIADAK